MVVTTSRIELFIRFLRGDFDGDFILIAGDALNGMSIDLPYLQSLANSPSWAFSQVKVKKKLLRVSQKFGFFLIFFAPGQSVSEHGTRRGVG